MSITATVKNYIQFTGDQESELIYSSVLADSPATQELVNLIDGNNEIEVPSIEDFVVHGVVIVPPSSEVVELTLKGVNGDTGIPISASKISLLQFGDTPPESFVIFIEGEIDGLRLVWF